MSLLGGTITLIGTFGDFAKVGLPLTILIGVVALWLAPIVYGF